MATIRRQGKKELPAVSTASLPDIIFMLLFFFMVSTSMKEVTYKVDIYAPEATELQSLEKKSLVRYVYIGEPKREFKGKYGSETRIQLDDAFADVSQLEEYVVREREAMNENDQNLLTISIKADKDTKMGIITDVKQALRRAYALKVNYAATKRAEY
ncbi:MAG: biopolymer transporter ExbD [Paludibacteraceae bacterium]|nr:biopolymer transporter ExbD [Paludibacteraceae bacterium]